MMGVIGQFDLNQVREWFRWVPAFDAVAGGVGFGVVTTATIVVLLWALYNPKMAIERRHRKDGGSALATARAVTNVAVTLGLASGLASGLYWGAGGGALLPDPNRPVVPPANPTGPTKPERPVASELVVYFDPQPGRPEQAVANRANLQYLTADDKPVGAPVVVQGSDRKQFEERLDAEVGKWAAGLPKDGKGAYKVTVYSQPFPGEGVLKAVDDIRKTRPGVEFAKVDATFKARAGG